VGTWYDSLLSNPIADECTVIGDGCTGGLFQRFEGTRGTDGEEERAIPCAGFECGNGCVIWVLGGEAGGEGLRDY